MIWSDADIRHEITLGHLLIEPFNEDALQPASIDVRLGDTFLFFPKGGIIVPTQPVKMESACLDSLYLHPNEFVLGVTQEKVTLGPGTVARIEGKSSLGRIGLAVHSTAGFVDPGFSGYLTLEIKNLSPLAICLEPGMWIAQLAFESTRTICDVPYNKKLVSRYRDAADKPEPTGSRLCENTGLQAKRTIPNE